MEGRREIHDKYFQPASGKKFAAVCSIEHMVMEASIVEVVERAPMERFPGAHAGIQTQIMFIQDLGEMRKIVLLREYFDPTRAAKAMETPILDLEAEFLAGKKDGDAILAGR